MLVRSFVALLLVLSAPGSAYAQLGGRPALPGGLGGIGGIPGGMPAGLPSAGLPSTGLPSAGLPGGALPSTGGISGVGGAPSTGGVTGAATGVTGDVVQRTGQVLGATDKALGATGAVAGTAVQRVVDSAGRPTQAGVFDTDPGGARIVKSEVLALSPSNAVIAAARALSFQIVRRSNLAGLNLSVTVLRAPRGMSANDALAALRMSAPSGVYDYNHVYDPSSDRMTGSGGGLERFFGFGRDRSPDARDISIGLVDAGIEVSHPALKGADIVTKNFAGSDKSPPAAHGTAVASLLVGKSETVNGALEGAKLYAADVYGGKADGGSADEVAQGLAWVAQRGAAVINVSLVGPPNRTLEAVIQALIARGHVIVAAVGNDGPAHRVGYPAAYDGVIAVTSVDSGMRVQIDANRGPEISYCAPGVDVNVAALNKTFERVTGTSFAAPLVAARFARLLAGPNKEAAGNANAELEREAIDLGAPGRDPVFGYGFLESRALARSVSFSVKKD